MSHKAVRWAMYDAPMLLTSAGEPDITARFVLVVRAERADDNGRDTYAGPSDVARATGYDERTVRRADRRLEQAGLLIRDGKSRHGTVRWHLAMKAVKAEGEPSPLDDRAARQKKANADRQQRYRDRLKAAANPPQEPQPIEGDVSIGPGVTAFKSVSNGLEERYVTAFKGVSNGLSAPQTTLRTTQVNHPGTTPGGAPPPDPRRPDPPTASGDRTESGSSRNPVPMQPRDEHRYPLPRASPHDAIAPVIPLHAWRSA
jgi:hypothetical protein